MTQEKTLLEEIDQKIAKIWSSGITPSHIIMSPITYSLFKEELGLDFMEDIHEYNTLKLSLTMDDKEYFEIV